jgi:MFS transporter, DHA1 family, multidrug resistance protein
MVMNPNMGWRWTAWMTLIMACVFGIIGFLVVPESFAPAILQRRATRIRYETQNWAYVSHEHVVLMRCLG